MARCDSYYGGQCTWGACEAAGWVPENLGDGGDWAANAARMGYVVTSVPTVGAACSYARGDGYSSFGHVGIVSAVYPDGTFEIHEMNYVAAWQYDDRRSNTYDVAGFILPPGVAPGSGVSQGMGAGPGGPGADNMAAVWSYLQGMFNDQLPDRFNRVNGANGLMGTFYG